MLNLHNYHEHSTPGTIACEVVVPCVPSRNTSAVPLSSSCATAIKNKYIFNQNLVIWQKELKISDEKDVNRGMFRRQGVFVD